MPIPTPRYIPVFPQPQTHVLRRRDKTWFKVKTSLDWVKPNCPFLADATRVPSQLVTTPLKRISLGKPSSYILTSELKALLTKSPALSGVCRECRKQINKWKIHPKEPTFSLEGKTDKEMGVENGAFWAQNYCIAAYSPARLSVATICALPHLTVLWVPFCLPMTLSRSHHLLPPQ